MQPPIYYDFEQESSNKPTHKSGLRVAKSSPFENVTKGRTPAWNWPSAGLKDQAALWVVNCFFDNNAQNKTWPVQGKFHHLGRSISIVGQQW
jgi:hypothetical protein